MTPKKTAEKYKYDEMVLKSNKSVRQMKLVGEDAQSCHSSYTTGMLPYFLLDFTHMTLIVRQLNMKAANSGLAAIFFQ